MAKWINRGTNKIGTFRTKKRGNKTYEFNQNLRIRIYEKINDVFTIPIFADEDISQKSKY